MRATCARSLLFPARRELPRDLHVLIAEVDARLDVRVLPPLVPRGDEDPIGIARGCAIEGRAIRGAVAPIEEGTDASRDRAVVVAGLGRRGPDASSGLISQQWPVAHLATDAGIRRRGRVERTVRVEPIKDLEIPGIEAQREIDRVETSAAQVREHRSPRRKRYLRGL